MSLSPWPESALTDWSSVDPVDDVVFFRVAEVVPGGCTAVSELVTEADSRLTTSLKDPAEACLWNSCLVDPTCFRALLTDVNSLPELEGEGLLLASFKEAVVMCNIRLDW